MRVDINLIHDDPDNVRRHSDPHSDRRLMDSILLTDGPIHAPIVRAHPDAHSVGLEALMIVAGHRRVHAARAAGMTRIEVVKTSVRNPKALAAIRTAENTAREPLAPVDMWRAIVKMQEAGWTLEDAADATGITQAYAKRLDKLGHMHPLVIDAIEKYGMPDPRQLATIALAPLDKQEAVMSLKAVFSGSGKNRSISWHDVGQRLTTQRISMDRAVFSVDQHPEVVFEEDLFAEPGSKDAIATTACVREFMAAQRAAIERIAEEKRGDGYNITFSDRAISYGTRIDGQTIESYDRLQAITWAKLPKGKTVDYVIHVVPEGWSAGTAIAGRLAAAASKPKKSKPSDSDQGSADGGTAPIAEREGVTLEGRKVAAHAKTVALRSAVSVLGNPWELLGVLVMACAGRNVTIRDSVSQFQNIDVAAITAQLLDNGDLPAPTDATQEAKVRAAAQELVRQMLSVDVPKTTFGSGPVADIIGRSIEAGAHMETRFDTEEFLQFVGGKEITAIYNSVGRKKPPGKLDAARIGLIGAVPDWRPNAAQFLAKLTPAGSEQNDGSDANEGDEDGDN